jgi:hypothetical protein
MFLGIFGGLWGFSYFTALLIGSSLSYLVDIYRYYYDYEIHIIIEIYRTGSGGYGFALGMAVAVLGLINWYLPDKFELPNFTDEESHEKLLAFE